jgi:hypothetical protein
VLTASDEYAHTPAQVPNWQENYVWHAWNPETRCGWNLHLGRIVEHGLVDVRAHVIIDGEVTAGSFQEPGDDGFAATGLDVDVQVAFDHVRLRYEGTGSHGPDAGGWFGREAGTTRFGFDVEMRTRHPVFDASAYPIVRDNLLDLEGNHYEVGASWSGRLWSGDTTVEASGLLVRDHSWGGRAWTWDALFWVPMVFDESRRFGFNWAQRRDGAWTSGSVFLDETGRVDAVDDFWVRLGGEPVPRRFDRAEVLRAGPGVLEHYVLSGDIHLPVGRAHSRVGLSDMYSTVQGADRTGFATIQIFPTEAEVERGFHDPLPRYRP